MNRTDNVVNMKVETECALNADVTVKEENLSMDEVESGEDGGQT
jgi:hypothetical protein